jgi:hypothetical protein
MHDHDAGPAPRDVYAPPEAPVVDLDERARATEFHVVSIGKFWCLLVATCGLYQYYWCYRQWANYRDWHREAMWPVARAIFAIFFMHPLNRHIDESLREARVRHAWWPGFAATTFVVFSIISTVVSRVTARVETVSLLDYVNLALILPVGWAMAVTQRAANAACGDPRGAGNARLTAANWAWIALGGAMWALILVGLVLPGDGA